MSERPSRRGLELLIRTSGDDGASPSFQIKVVRADRAFLRMRPMRVDLPGVEVNAIHEVTGTVHIVHLPHAEQHLRLTASQYATWQKMDGEHSIQDLATALVFEHGRFDFDEVRQTLTRLRAAGLVEVRPSRLVQLRSVPGGDAVRSVAAALANFDHRWSPVDDQFAQLYGWVKPLLGRPAVAAQLVVGVVGLGLYLSQRWTGVLVPSLLPLWAWALTVFLTMPVFMSVHELAHGVACKAYGRRVRAVGLMMADYVLPTVYVDVTDMSMSTRAGRMVVDMAGPFANVVLGGLFTVAAVLVPNSWVTDSCVVLADVNFALALFTAWPVHGLKEDGYQALSEYLRLTLLRRRCLTWAASRLHLRPRGLAVPTRYAVMYVAGVVVSWAGLAAALALWVSWRF